MSCYSSHQLNLTANETFSVHITTTPSVEHWLDVFHVACAPLTVFLNAVVLHIGVRRIDTSLRLNQYYVISMTLADLTFGLVYLSTKLFTDCFPTWICRVYYVITWASQILSVTSLLLLNIDKFISLYYPLKYQQIVTKELVLTLTSVIWCLSVSYPSVAFLSPLSSFPTVDLLRNGVHMRIISSCHVRLRFTFYLIMLVGFYVFPTLLSLCISVYIFWIAQHITQSYLSGVSGSRNSQKLSTTSRTKQKQKIVKRILFVFSSTIWTAVTYLPYRIVYCATMFCNLTCTTNQCRQMCRPDAVVKMGYGLWFLLPLGCVGNPIITVVTQRIYRIQLKRLCREILIDRFGCPIRFFPCLRQKNSFHREETQSMRLDENSGVTMRIRGTSVKRPSLAAVRWNSGRNVELQNL